MLSAFDKCIPKKDTGLGRTIKRTGCGTAYIGCFGFHKDCLLYQGTEVL